MLPILVTSRQVEKGGNLMEVGKGCMQTLYGKFMVG